MIALATCFWKRPDLSRFFMEYWHRLAGALPLLLYGAVSPEDPFYEEHLRVASHLPVWRMFDVPNEKLWLKFDTLVAEHIRNDPEAKAVLQGLLVMGSDDIANRSYVRIVDVMLETCDFIQPGSCIMFEPETGLMSLLNGFDGGAGRAYSRHLLEKRNWHVWESNEDTFFSIDNHNKILALNASRRSVTLPVTSDTPWQIMDIKSAEEKLNMWFWSDFSPEQNPLATWLDARDTIERHFPDAFECTGAAPASAA